MKHPNDTGLTAQSHRIRRWRDFLCPPKTPHRMTNHLPTPQGKGPYSPAPPLTISLKIARSSSAGCASVGPIAKSERSWDSRRRQPGPDGWPSRLVSIVISWTIRLTDAPYSKRIPLPGLRTTGGSPIEVVRTIEQSTPLLSSALLDSIPGLRPLTVKNIRSAPPFIHRYCASNDEARIESVRCLKRMTPNAPNQRPRELTTSFKSMVTDTRELPSLTQSFQCCAPYISRQQNKDQNAW